MHLKKIRLCVVLPTINIFFAFVLLAIGRAEMIREFRTREARGGIYEPVPAAYERARFLSYAINAPAWVLQLHMPTILHIQGSKYWGGEGARFSALEDEKDYWYICFLGGFWLYIGYRLDHHTHAPNAPERSYVIFILSLAFAILLLNSIYSGARLYEGWFRLAVIIWASALSIFGLYTLIRDRFATSR